MTHQQLIPEATRAPYSLQGALADQEELWRSAEAAEWMQADHEVETWIDRARDNKIGIGAAFGIGSAAVFAALLFAWRDKFAPVGA